MRNCINFSQSNPLVTDHPLFIEHLVASTMQSTLQSQSHFFPAEVGVITLSSWTWNLRNRKVE